MSLFYNGKKILVTGSTGFKGSRLSLRLQSLGADVLGYGLKPNTEPNNFTILDLENKIKQIYGDIRDYELLEKVVDEFKPDMLFHLAAQPLVRDSYGNPTYTMETNTMGTVNVLELLRTKSYLQGGVFITTDKVYENQETLVPYKETDRLGGHDPYSSSKAMAELAINSYIKSFFGNEKKVGVVRAGNVIGGGDWSKDRLIPDMIKSIINGEKLILRNPDAVRPWQYVLEALYGYLIIGEKIFEDDKYLGHYNFGPDISDNLRVIDIVEATIKIFGQGTYEIVSENHKQHEAKLLLLDNTKAKEILDWKPKYSVEEVIYRTMSYYKKYYDGDNMVEIALQEIRQFNF